MAGMQNHSNLQNKRALLAELRTAAASFSMLDIVKIRAFMLAEVKHLPEKYRKMYSIDLFDYLYQAFLELQGTKLQHPGDDIAQDEFEDVNARINELSVDAGPAKAKYINFLRIAVLYLIFVAKKPIHPPGMKFPGNLEIISKNGDYFCPAKEKQSEVEIALCKFCICKDLSDLE